MYAVREGEIDFRADLAELESKHTRSLKQMKIAVLYARPGQIDMESLWTNQPPEDSGFYKFLDSISTKVDMTTWTGYRGRSF